MLDLTTGQQRVVSRIAGLSYLNTWFVKFDPVQKPFVVSTQHYKDTVTVVIYTHDGNRAYQETLKRGGTAAVLPQPNNTEKFLLTNHLTPLVFGGQSSHCAGDGVRARITHQRYDSDASRPDC